MIQGNGAPAFIATDSHESLSIRPSPKADQFTVGPGPGVGEPEQFHAISFGPHGRFRLSQVDGHRLIAEMGKVSRFPLPQSTVKQWVRARSDDVSRGLRPEQAVIDEDIGPVQVVGNYLWFGKTFYNGEGSTGVGGFGYFNPATRKYVLFSPLAVRPWSVAALLVEQDALWLALVHRGEYGDSSGGVLRWGRETQKIKRYPLRPVATAITRYQDKLFLATIDGIAVLEGNRFRRFFVDGRRRVLEESY